MRIHITLCSLHLLFRIIYIILYIYIYIFYISVYYCTTQRTLTTVKLDKWSCISKPIHHPQLYNSWCLFNRGVRYALLMRAKKPETAVQGSIFIFLLAPHGLLHHMHTHASLDLIHCDAAGGLNSCAVTETCQEKPITSSSQ